MICGPVDPTIKIENLSKGSAILINVKCDDCGVEWIREYRYVILGKFSSKYCKKCCHKYKNPPTFTEEQLDKFRVAGKTRNLGRSVSQKTRDRISKANTKPIEFYIDLFKNIIRYKYNLNHQYQCDQCDNWFNPTKHQMGELVRWVSSNNHKKLFCSKECKGLYMNIHYSHTLFQKGHNVGGTSWNKGIPMKNDTKKKVSDGFKKNLESHKLNMRLAACATLRKLKEMGILLTYPRRGLMEIECLNLFQSISPYLIEINMEVVGVGRFIDGYIKELNLAIEFDEKEHFEFINGNYILKECDIIRQNEISDELKCDFLRINFLDWENKEECKNMFMNKIKSMDVKIT